MPRGYGAPARSSTRAATIRIAIGGGAATGGFGQGAFGATDAFGQEAFGASPAWAFAQSALNCSIPLSVSGWWTICWRTLNGTVAMWAPASADWVTWSGLRMDAEMIYESIS